MFKKLFGKSTKAEKRADEDEAEADPPKDAKDAKPPAAQVRVCVCSMHLPCA
jgi:hypothetical protein